MHLGSSESPAIFLHLTYSWTLNREVLAGLPRVREKSGKFEFFHGLTVNFANCQGNLELVVNVREFVSEL